MKLLEPSAREVVLDRKGKGKNTWMDVVQDRCN
jgi:hypothetical protein